MVAKPQQHRQSEQRLRAYIARASLHKRVTARRKRDNVVGILTGILAFGVAVLLQVGYLAGPGKAAASAASPATPASSPHSTSTNSPTTNVPPATIAAGRHWTGTLSLNGISASVDLDGAAAPQAVSSTISLAQKGFYNGLSCHRLTTSLIQCGDPIGNGTGGPGYSYGPVENAPASAIYPAGTIAMARRANDAYSNGSQFFIVYRDVTLPADSAGGYSVIGKINNGLDALTSLFATAGITGGASDGKPAAPINIGSFRVN